MSKKTNKQRPAKAVKPPTPRCGPPTPSTRVTFYTTATNTGKRYHWRAHRGGQAVAASSLTYLKKDKCTRSFLRLVDSFASGDWIATNESKP